MRALTTIMRNKFAVDYHKISNFNEDLTELRSITKKFADQEIAPLAHKVDVEDKFPNHLWRKFGELGLLGMTTPAKYGGSELNYTAHTMVMEELSRASASIALSYGAHTALCLAQITRHGN